MRKKEIDINPMDKGHILAVIVMIITAIILIGVVQMLGDIKIKSDKLSSYVSEDNGLIKVNDKVTLQ